MMVKFGCPKKVHGIHDCGIQMAAYWLTENRRLMPSQSQTKSSKAVFLFLHQLLSMSTMFATMLMDTV